MKYNLIFIVKNNSFMILDSNNKFPLGEEFSILLLRKSYTEVINYFNRIAVYDGDCKYDNKEGYIYLWE